MDTLSMREFVHVPGPFASVYLPSAAAWPVLRPRLAAQHVEETVLDVLDEAVARHGATGHALVTALVSSGGTVLVDECPSWRPAAPVGRVSDLPYLLPLAHHHAAAGERPVAEWSAYDQFVFESSRPGGLAVDGLPLCTRGLREGNADALVVSVDRLGDETVWVGGDQQDHLVGTDDSLRALGVPISRQRADEALPLAALAVGAELIVTAESLPLADGVGVLLRHP
ncbi:hypothetical protein [Actinophytocola gossypii]|uniref:Uncharacterized protein n=1 Tax=Actinophytocola gossypii TaxID=2812003 RepID=A0ABT2J713_9PSEU|nr:hypothetical protein [Actinophytocola gossypii]MCT2583481.1 hypothetical protein [Actinophytocola gossypii]